MKRKSASPKRTSTRQADGRTRLSGQEVEQVLAILRRPPMSYMDHPALHGPDPVDELFTQAPAIPEPNCDWYRPGIEIVFDGRQPPPQPNTLLTAAQEKAIFLQFNYARFRAARLHQELDAEAIDPQKARELLFWNGETQRLRDRIVEFNLALVLAMARHVAAARLDFTDMLSEGNMALLRAVDKFDVGRNFKFSTYACRAILKAFSRMSVMRARRNTLGFSFEESMGDGPAIERTDSGELTEYASALRRALDANEASLTSLEKRVLAFRFPMEDDRSSDRPTLNEVGREIGYSKERVRQIQQQALDKLRFYLESTFNEAPFESIPD